MFESNSPSKFHYSFFKFGFKNVNSQLAYSFFNLAPDEDLLIRSKYRASPVNRDVRNYNQITCSFRFDIINYMQQSAETPTYYILFHLHIIYQDIRKLVYEGQYVRTKVCRNLLNSLQTRTLDTYSIRVCKKFMILVQTTRGLQNKS